LTLAQVLAVYATNPKGNPPVELLRDLFGNPFHPVPVNPDWLTEEVRLLALEMYKTRDFSRMPRLGELLRSAGCSDAEVLAHCRQRFPHVRGCWLLDSLQEGVR